MALADLRCESWVQWVPSKVNPADMLTKYLDKATWLKYASYMYNCDLSALPSASERLPSASLKGGV